MSLADITIVRRFPIINNYVVIPDYGSNKIPVATALTIPGTKLNGLVGSIEFLDTTPGVVECCANVPADHISETVKDEVPRTEQGPCVCPDMVGYTSVYLSATFYNENGGPAYIPQEQCGCDSEFVSRGAVLSPDNNRNCFWTGSVYNKYFLAMVYYDTQQCIWITELWCADNLIWQGSSDTRFGDYTSTYGNWCSGIDHSTIVDASDYWEVFPQN